ncbi:MAG: 4-hydroxythreonine-4-phosphate dehydrogenase PdxA [Candidatus Omnitrophota bacterium]|nr:MAG: 4-hydroxythreonine-4-phosphate dehydrogenase PdxA [Candidatus Omnitrophota bacterium]
MAVKKIVITTGDPAGCGPLITLDALNSLKDANADFFVVGDERILKRFPIYTRIKKRFCLIGANSPYVDKIKSGYPSRLCGQAALNYLRTGLKTLKKEKIKRLVTAPVSKEAIQKVVSGFSGHTEYLADYFGVKNFEMMMVSPELKVVLGTRHIPLRKVCASIQTKNIIKTLNLVHSSLLKMFKIKNPKIALVSINPHAGINTHLEKEERIMLDTLKRVNAKIFGPFPADTIFIEQNLKKYDCLVCFYHDQAMIPFKLLSIKEGVNLTLGLPIIRTSPAHGVAFDVMKAGKKPFSSSMVAAIRLALKLQV